VNIYAENGDLKSEQSCEQKLDSLDYFYYGRRSGLRKEKSNLAVRTLKRDMIWVKVKVLINSGNLREAKAIIDKEIPSLNISEFSRYQNANTKHLFPKRVIADTIVNGKKRTVVTDTIYWQLKGTISRDGSKVEKDTTINTYTVFVTTFRSTTYFNVSTRHIQDPNRIELDHKKRKDYRRKRKNYNSSNNNSSNAGGYTFKEAGFYRANSVLGQYYMATQQYDSSIYFYEKYIVGMFNEFFTTDDFELIGRSYVLLAKLRLLNDQPKVALKMSRKGHRVLSHHWSTRWNSNSGNDLLLASTSMSESYRMKNKIGKAFKWSGKAQKYYEQNSKGNSIQAMPYLANRAMLYWTVGNIDSAYYYFSALDKQYYSFLYKNFSYLSEHERINIYNSTIHYLDYSKAFFLAQISDSTAIAEKCKKDLFELNANTKGVLLSSSRKEMDKIYHSENAETIELYEEIRGIKELLSYGVNEKSQFDALNVALDIRERQLSSLLKIKPDEFISYEDVLLNVPDSTQLVDILRCNKIGKDKREALYITDSSAYVYFISKADKSGFVTRCNTRGNDLSGRFYKNYFNTIRIKIPSVTAYRNYWEILEEDLVSPTVVICGDGIYHLINPNILYNGSQYLIDRKNIYSISTVKEILEKDTSAFTVRSIQLIGRPDFSNYKYLDSYSGVIPADLPGTEQEVNSICSIIPPPATCDIWMGKEANEHSIKNISSPGILHLATHGYFENRSIGNPLLNSGLLFSIEDTSRDDGHLTAYEASNLDLKNTDMVVLSACETGLGTMVEGDGVWGLRRSFQIAGVHYVIMSMFKVNDKITAQLMVLFYTNITLGQSIPTAFKNAELSIKSQYPDPMYWGAFILIGY